jgi:hypothetical protein
MTAPATASAELSPVRERINVGIQLFLFFISLAGSFDHLAHLFVETGQPWPEAAITALIVDIGVYRFAQERQRDKRIGRTRRGPMSLPTVFLFGAIAISLAGNAWDAELTAWGIIGAVLPGVFLLASIILTERQAAEDYRRAVAAAASAEAQEQAEAERGAEAERAEAAIRETERQYRKQLRRERQEQRRAPAGAPEVHQGRAPGASQAQGSGAPEAQPGTHAPMTQAQAEAHFMPMLAAGGMPTIRTIRAECGVGAGKAAEYCQHFESVLAGRPGQEPTRSPLHLVRPDGAEAVR